MTTWARTNYATGPDHRITLEIDGHTFTLRPYEAREIAADLYRALQAPERHSKAHYDLMLAETAMDNDR
jgi:hypothetical protein